MRVLILSPHPDDDLIGCGGSMIKHLEAGNTIDIVYMTSGDAGDARLGRVREKEVTAAAASLDIPKTSLHFLRQTDGSLEASTDLVSELVDLIRKNKPNVVYLPHALDDHLDHIATNSIGVKALNMSANESWHTSKPAWNAGTVLAYEVWTPIQSFQYLEDTTNVLSKQLEALALHKSQMEMVAYDDMVKSLGRYRGLLIGKDCYAEVFNVVKIESSSLSS